ncbi:MAG: ABC transporter permease [Gammaproteobacteria bacterium]|nr:ABC transporter permease [Gammaproteobacteria bacterium]
MTKVGTTLLEPYILLFRYRKLLWDSVKNSLQARYAGSIFGLGWIVKGPLMLLGLYALIYAVVFRVRPVGLELADYILYIFAGLIPFIAFSQALSAGAVALSNDPGLLLNKVFPAELLPVREVLAAGTMIIAGGFLVIVYKLFLGGITWYWLLLPLILLLMAMTVVGMVWGLSLANLLIKDVQQMLTYIIILLLVASPIAYTPDMIPPSMQILIYANPLAYYVMSFQSILVLGQLPPIPIMIGDLLISLVWFHGMFAVFKSGKLVLTDNI